MRAQLSGLFRRVLKDARVAQALRARRQRNSLHLQGTAPGSFVVYPGPQDRGGCRCYGCAGRRAGGLVRSFR